MGLKEVSHNVSAYGGIAASLFAAVFAFFAGMNSLALQLVIMLVLVLVIIGIVRIFYFRERPDKTKYKSWIGKLDASSFPSMHAMRAFGLSTVLAINIPVPGIIALVSLMAVITGALRVFQKRHHASDVIVGSILGIGVGVLSWYLGNL